MTRDTQYVGAILAAGRGSRMGETAQRVPKPTMLVGDAPVIAHQVRAMESVGIRKFFNGPECFTPDAKHYLGPVPDVAGYWVAAGFNSTGIQNGPGAGKALAEWIMAGHMTMDLTDVDSRRIMPGLNARSYTATKAAETLGLETGYASIEALLCDDSVQVVHIASPNRFHLPQRESVLAKGLIYNRVPTEL